jgi:HSP20 family protein
MQVCPRCKYVFSRRPNLATLATLAKRCNDIGGSDMSKVNVQTVSNPEDRSLPIFAEIDKLFDQVREEAYKRFQVRGFSSGSELEDWFGAERKLCRPDAELKEDEQGFRLDVALAGFDPEDIELTATPQALIVKATHEAGKSGKDDKTGKICWSEFRHNDVYRYVPLPADLDVDRVKAELRRGVLKIEAPKAPSVTRKSKNVRISGAA